MVVPFSSSLIPDFPYLHSLRLCISYTCSLFLYNTAGNQKCSRSVYWWEGVPQIKWGREQGGNVTCQMSVLCLCLSGNWDFEQPGLKGGIPVYSKGLGTLNQLKPFYDSMIHCSCMRCSAEWDSFLSSTSCKFTQLFRRQFSITAQTKAWSCERTENHFSQQNNKWRFMPWLK